MENQGFEIGQEVTFSNAFGVNVIVEIKGKTAKTFEKNTGLYHTKRLSSLKIHKDQQAYWGEQEIAHLTTQKHNHGDVVFSSLSGDGNGVKVVWDDIKKQCVKASEISIIK